MTQIHGFSHRSTNLKVLELAKPLLMPGKRALDLGAGEGYFSQLAGEYVALRFGVAPDSILTACDPVAGQFRYSRVRCDELTDGTLPYADESFDLVCSIEVIEHVEDQYRFLREAHRVLRPGGVFLASTPNVLNLSSRWRYFHSGFAHLFNPMRLDSDDRIHTSGHIHPISYYYLAYAMHAVGFRDTTAHYDRFKRSALFPMLLLGAPMMLARLGFLARLRRKHPLELRENRQLVRTMNSFGMLTSRSVVVRGLK